jgi:hypothetical protein
MDGRVGARGQLADVEQDFDDVLDLLEDHADGILQGSLSVWYGRWGFSFASSWLRLEAERAFLVPAGAGAEVVSEIWQGQANVWYRLSATPLGCEPCSPWVLQDMYVGLRFMDVDTEIRTPAALREDSEAWADPVIGWRAAYVFGRRWTFDVQTDLGGFGIASDWTWLLRMGVEWHPTPHVGLKAGWMWIETDYERGSGSDRFVWDVIQDGPYLFLTVRF